jgi:hypothetical protein
MEKIWGSSGGKNAGPDRGLMPDRGAVALIVGGKAMKQKQWLTILTVFLSLASSRVLSPAESPGYLTGNTLVEDMREFDKSKANPKAIDVSWDAVGYYDGYISGVADATHSLYNVPSGVTYGQLSAIVSKYLKNHPEKWNKPAVDLVIFALQEAFPFAPEPSKKPNSKGE